MLQSITDERKQNKKWAGGEHPKLEPQIVEDCIKCEHSEPGPGQEGHMKGIHNSATSRLVVDARQLLVE